MGLKQLLQLLAGQQALHEHQLPGADDVAITVNLARNTTGDTSPRTSILAHDRDAPAGEHPLAGTLIWVFLAHSLP